MSNVFTNRQRIEIQSNSVVIVVRQIQQLFVTFLLTTNYVWLIFDFVVVSYLPLNNNQIHFRSRMKL